MVEGMYAVEYLSNIGFPGCGMVTLKGGEIKGSDAGYDWQGTYNVSGGKVVAQVEISTDKGALNVFAEIGSIQLDFEGEETPDGLLFFWVRRDRPEQTMQNPGGPSLGSVESAYIVGSPQVLWQGCQNIGAYDEG